MRRIGVPAEGQDRGMLEQKQLIRDAVLGPGVGEAALERPGGAIRNATKPACLQRLPHGQACVPVVRVESDGVHARHDSRAIRSHPLDEAGGRSEASLPRRPGGTATVGRDPVRYLGCLPLPDSPEATVCER